MPTSTTYSFRQQAVYDDHILALAGSTFFDYTFTVDGTVEPFDNGYLTGEPFSGGGNDERIENPDGTVTIEGSTGAGVSESGFDSENWFIGDAYTIQGDLLELSTTRVDPNNVGSIEIHVDGRLMSGPQEAVDTISGDIAPECSGDGDCPPGHTCSGGECQFDSSVSCVRNTECPSGQVCQDGKCVTIDQNDGSDTGGGGGGGGGGDEIAVLGAGALVVLGLLVAASRRRDGVYAR